VARLEKWLIVLIALHSVGVGVMLMVFPGWALRFAGWGDADPMFFPRQGGVFHVVVAVGYLIEYFRYRGVLLLVAAKGIALVFLLTVSLLTQVPWAVPFCGITDGLMGLVAWFVHSRVKRARVPEAA